MGDYRKERLMLAIIILSGFGNIAETIIAGWELWVIPIIVVGALGTGWLHIARKADMIIRTDVFFVYAAFLVFFHGMHEISYFDVSIVTLIMMATFMMADRAAFLNLILIEYVVIMGIQFYMQTRAVDLEDITSVSIIRTLLHIGVVLCMYLLGRILVSSRIASAKKLDEWKEAVGANDRDTEDFLSNISHELRTPINVISGMTTIMQKENDSKELAAVKAAVMRLAYQIDDIQDYTEIKRGELALEEENYTCISLINDVVANYKAMENKKGLELVVDIAPETPTMLRGDIKKLHKLFRHLLDNAVKFTGRGGIYIKVFSVPQEYGINLTIEVTDTGAGMDRAQISRLSKGMYQADKKRNRSTGGIGIGLPIVYGFVHTMGGFVRINSAKRKGTTVRLTIPQAVVDKAPCLSVNDASYDGIVFYTKPEKYKTPEVREFYRDMATGLASGLRARLYSASEKRELERLLDDLRVSHIFTGQEEYEADRDYLEGLTNEGYKVIVTAGEGFETVRGSGVLVIPKPLYGFPVVRIMNGEEDGFSGEATGKVRFTGVSALIVDDEPMNLVVASGLLKEYRMYADTAESGREAIEKFSRGEYDVIFMDHMMPQMDGVEAMKHIREIAEESRRHPAIIALTANALSGAREMFMKEGFDGFIAKPIDIGEFERVMKHVLPDDMIKYS